jgi:cysteine desulfurase / selenocysteine lyase
MDVSGLNPGGMPDVSELERLANQFFKAIPGGQTPPAEGVSGLASDAIHLPHVPATLEEARSEHPIAASVYDSAPSFGLGQIPVSQAGVGKSPSAVAHPVGNEHDAVIPKLPEQSYSGGIPQSVAGGGQSPSYIRQPNNFDLNQPQTSLPDPQTYDGRIPASVAGSGKQPSLSDREAQLPFQGQQHSSHLLPFESEQPFQKELEQALIQVQAYVPSAQIPLSGIPGTSDASFYFLSGFGNAPRVLGQRDAQQAAPATHGISAYVKPPFDINLVRADFPILKERVNGRPLAWLDNAATTQKPNLVIDRISHFYRHENSNIHRAAHELAARATDAYEAARAKVRTFINASSVNEIVFVRGTTEGINLVAKSWGEQHLNSGDEIIVSHLEHHANIVPWQQLAAKKGLKIRVIPVDDDGQIILEEYGKLLNSKTKLVAFTHVSNALGTVTPAKAIIAMAHAAGAKVLLDGAQSVSHVRVDLQDLNPDFFVFSGHKVFGPTGIGVVYGKEDILNATDPWQGGGNMIKDVTFEHTEFHDAPGRFEAGTGNIADAVGLGAAIDYVTRLGIDAINQYEHALLAYGTHLLKQVPGIRLVGTAHEKASVMSFVLDGYTNDEVGQALNKEGIAVRTGHHCAQPILRRFGLESTVRPSLAFYNTCEEVDRLVSVLHALRNQRPIGR